MCWRSKGGGPCCGGLCRRRPCPDGPEGRQGRLEPWGRAGGVGRQGEHVRDSGLFVLRANQGLKAEQSPTQIRTLRRPRGLLGAEEVGSGRVGVGPPGVPPGGSSPSTTRTIASFPEPSPPTRGKGHSPCLAAVVGISRPSQDQEPGLFQDRCILSEGPNWAVSSLLWG